MRPDVYSITTFQQFQLIFRSELHKFRLLQNRSTAGLNTTLGSGNYIY